ncbi:unnamed protein product [Bemisia tabaci]|uniref:Kinetochore protein SPC25 n=1 Tax=Bemisia tabaci TaxID=7038 RepID=A0A9P0AKP7_BEMTA|nr:unnamed protein product [Bemisia tabaci]
MKCSFFSTPDCLQTIDEDIREFKKKFGNFTTHKAETLLLEIIETLDFFSSDDNSKIGTLLKLKETVEALENEIKEEYSGDGSLENFVAMEKEIKGMAKTCSDLQRERKELQEDIEKLNSLWTQKNVEMDETRDKVMDKFNLLEQITKLYEKHLGVFLCPVGDSSFRLMFNNDLKQPMFINLKYENGLIKVVNVNTSTQDKEAIVKKVKSSADYQGLLSVMDSYRK